MGRFIERRVVDIALTHRSKFMIEYFVIDVAHPFYNINELRFFESASAIDYSERLRDISYVIIN